MGCIASKRTGQQTRKDCSKMTWLQDMRTGHTGALTNELPNGLIEITEIEPLLIVDGRCDPVDALAGPVIRRRACECVEVTRSMRIWGRV